MVYPAGSGCLTKSILFYNIVDMETNNYLYRLEKDHKIDYEVASFDAEPAYKDLRKKNIKSYLIFYSSPFRTGITENDRVHSELFIPEKNNGSSNVVIFLHGFTSKLHSLRSYYKFISRAAEHGHSCFFINLPFHLHRTPPGEKSGQRLIQNRDTGTLNFFNQAVLDIKKGIRIINKLFSEAREIKTGTARKMDFSICGLSLGGMISVASMAWEKSIKKGVLLQCGGNWDTIYWNSLVRVIMHGCFIDKENIKREQAKEFYLPIKEFIEKFRSADPKKIDRGLSEYPELSAYRQKTWFLSDPLTFAHKINHKNVIMINSRFDFLFSRDSTIQLWHELGKPQIYWINDIHSSWILSNKKVLKLIFNFL